MSKKQRSAFLSNVFSSPEATQDLQDRIDGHTGFRPGAQPDGGAVAPPGPGAGQPGVFQFVVEILLSPTRGDRKLLPIAIDRDLPQIQLQFGIMDSDVSIRPTVSGIVDSGASLCIGNLGGKLKLLSLRQHDTSYSDNYLSPGWELNPGIKGG